MNKLKIILLSIMLILSLFQVSYADVVLVENLDPVSYGLKFNLLIMGVGIFMLLGMSLLALFGIKYFKNRSNESVIEQTNQQELDQ